MTRTIDDGDDPAAAPVRRRARRSGHVTGGTHGCSLGGGRGEQASTPGVGRRMPVPGGELLAGRLGAVQPVVLAVGARGVARAGHGHPLRAGRPARPRRRPWCRQRRRPPRGHRPGARSARPSTPGRPIRRARPPPTPRPRPAPIVGQPAAQRADHRLGQLVGDPDQHVGRRTRCRSGAGEDDPGLGRLLQGRQGGGGDTSRPARSRRGAGRPTSAAPLDRSCRAVRSGCPAASA